MGDREEPTTDPRRQANPDDLFRLAARDPFVAAFVQMWRRGDVSFEQMLLSLAVAQTDRVAAIYNGFLKGK